MFWDAVAEIWRTGWDLHPSLLAAIGGLVVLYVAGVVVVGRRSGERLSVGQGAWFATGILTLLLTLQSPLHHLSDTYLFSAHMAQHTLLILVVAPLLLLGTPAWLVHGLLDRPWIIRAAHGPAYPIVALGGFNLLFAFVHFPAIYDAVFGLELAHRAAHIAILAGAVVTWLPLLSPVPDIIPRLPPPAQLLYCFVQTIPTSMVGALLTLSDRILYHHYGARPFELGMSPLADQQLAGLLMWVVGGTFWYLVLTVIFFRWADGEEFRAYA